MCRPGETILLSLAACGKTSTPGDGGGGMVTHRHDVSPRRPRRIYLNFEQKNGRIRTSQYTLFISQVQRNIQKFTHGCIYYLEH